MEKQLVECFLSNLEEFFANAKREEVDRLFSELLSQMVNVAERCETEGKAYLFLPADEEHAYRIRLKPIRV